VRVSTAFLSLEILRNCSWARPYSPWRISVSFSSTSVRCCTVTSPSTRLQNAAALFLHGAGKLLDLLRGLAKSSSKALAEENVGGSTGGQHPRMVERGAEALLDVAHPLHDARVHQFGEMPEIFRFLADEGELAH